MRRLAMLSCALVACGSSPKGGSPDAHPAIPDATPTPDVAIVPDAPPVPDASKLPDAMPTADAQMVDLSCVGAGPATKAPDPVTISGIVQETMGFGGEQPSMGTNVDFLMTNETTSIMSTLTATDGSYALALPTGMQPLAGVGHLTKDQFIDFWLYPPEPLFQDFPNVPGVMVSTSDTGLVAAFFGGFGTQFQNMVVVEVVDCSNHAIAGATVTLSTAPAKEAYAGTDYLPDTKLTKTSPAGLYEGLNVDSSTPVTASGMFGTTVLHGATSFNVHDGAITATIIHP